MWRDLSDDELRQRLMQRNVDEVYARTLTANRDDERAERIIDDYLDPR